MAVNIGLSALEDDNLLLGHSGDDLLVGKKGDDTLIGKEDYEEDDFEEEDDIGWQRDTYYDVELNTWMIGGVQPECNIPDRG